MSAGNRQTTAAAGAERQVIGEISRARGLDPLRRLVDGEKGFESRRSVKGSR